LANSTSGVGFPCCSCLRDSNTLPVRHKIRSTHLNIAKDYDNQGNNMMGSAPVMSE
jgi:hypothetical protein